MKYVDPDRWPWILVTYLVGGLALGLADPLVRGLTERVFGSSAAGTWVNVIVALTALNAFLSAGYPRYRIALPGAFGPACGFTLGAVLIHGRMRSDWSVSTLTFDAGRVLVIAGGGYVVVAALTVAIAHRWRCVGWPDPECCVDCGYLLRGLTVPR